MELSITGKWELFYNAVISAQINMYIFMMYKV